MSEEMELETVRIGDIEYAVTRTTARAIDGHTVEWVKKSESGKADSNILALK